MGALTGNPGIGSYHMKIKIGSQTFDATLEANATAVAFKTMLPLAIKMEELNGNEKFHRLPRRLPTNDSSPGTIKNGDLMWGEPRAAEVLREGVKHQAIVRLTKQA